MSPAATHGGIPRPSPETLRRYGLSFDEWLAILERQDYACGACGKQPPSGRLFIDHEHARGWKQMEPEKRKTYVRGLACYVCNRFILNYRVTIALLRGAADYLEGYERRRLRGLGD